LIDIDKSEVYYDSAQKLKNVKKLIKYQEGYSRTPAEHKERILKNIKHFENKIGISDLSGLYALKTDLEKKIELKETTEKSRNYLEQISGWYYRPLINHFDNVHKLQILTSKAEGAGALRNKLQIFITDSYYQQEKEMTVKSLQEFFKFKAMGKNTDPSAQLERQFYEQFEFTNQNPFPGSTLGNLGLPVIHYNIDSFWSRLDAEEESVLITGLCPLSTVANELGFVLTEDKIIRPKLGFELLSVEHQDIIGIDWPKRPIITDYIILKNILELYKIIKDKTEVNVIIWYPFHEYYLDLTENIFKNYLHVGIIKEQQIVQEMNKIKDKYYKLVEFVKSELGLGSDEYKNNIKLIEVDSEIHNNLEELKNKFDFSFFKYIYGRWLGNDLRRTLYEHLVLKHMKPVFDGVNTLHLDTSYELWIDVLASIIVERERPPGNYSFISYPSVPSINLSHMREYNASFDQKLYLAMDKTKFQSQIENLSKKYILHLAPLLLDKNSIINKEESEIVKEFLMKLITINDIF
jgi:hypothetical protein